MLELSLRNSFCHALTQKLNAKNNLNFKINQRISLLKENLKTLILTKNQKSKLLTIL